MQTIRGRRTVWYSAALVLTLTAFAIVLYVARRRASYDDLDQRIRSEADLTAAILGESYRARGVLVTYDSTRKPALVADIKAVLEAVPDYLLITAPLGGSWIARGALEPVDRIISEGREITDGRSLHRRLAEPMVKDELGRLAETLNQMMTRLERSFAALRRFTADASHELKTPLTVLRAGVERAITTPNLSQDTLATLEETLQEIKRMTELVDALLTLARADEGIAPLHREPVDLRGIVEEVRETGELLAEESGVRMEVATPPEPIVVSVDATRIRQLILNLLTNAVKYTPAGGSVRMQLGSANGRVTLSVADTGIGIAPGDLPHIFDRFWRADSARTRTSERPGAGLGLAICKWIAEAHGGRIDVVSRPGRGTTFTVTLPRELPAMKS